MIDLIYSNNNYTSSDMITKPVSPTRLKELLTNYGLIIIEDADLEKCWKKNNNAIRSVTNW